MQKRRFGRTGHMSTIAILGGAAFGRTTQAQTDHMMELVMASGINHIDVAPSYGHAEDRLRPWITPNREHFFLGCKTTERAKSDAGDELKRSLERLGVDSFDLYQIHAVTTFEELDEATRSGGVLEAIIEARESGLTRFIGITGHGVDSPGIFLEALRRFDFDSILFPINFIQYANPVYRKECEEVINLCRRNDVGTMIIKSIARGPWGNLPKTHTTWYRPFTERDQIQKCVNFALSQDITGICTAGDLQVLPMILETCQDFTPMSDTEQQALIASSDQFQPLFE